MRVQQCRVRGGLQYGLNSSGGTVNFYRNNVLIGNGLGGVVGHRKHDANDKGF